jgi:general secretion pathway protein J
MRTRGFTLIEVLLAITLLSTIMALAVGGLRAAQRASTSGEAVIEQTNNLRVVHQFVRRQLSQAQAMVIEQDENDDVPTRFIGESDWVRFVAPMPGYLSYGGLYVQQFAIEPGPNGRELVFYFAMLNGYEQGEIEQTQGVVLLDGLNGGDFWYLGEDPETDQPLWSNAWERVDALPLSVELDLDLVRENQMVWPTVAAAVRVDANPARQQRTIRSGADLLIPNRRR